MSNVRPRCFVAFTGLCMLPRPHCSRFFFFNDTATTEIYTLSLHDALPIFFLEQITQSFRRDVCKQVLPSDSCQQYVDVIRSEEHTSELQSQSNLVCRLLLEKKKSG